MKFYSRLGARNRFSASELFGSNHLLIRVFKRLIRTFIAVVTPINSRRIILVQESWSGSNTWALYRFASEDTKHRYEVIIYEDRPDGTLVEYCRKHRLLSTARIIVTTHASYKPSRRHIHIQLWHGAFVKKNGVMLASKPNSTIRTPKDWLRVDYIMSYSDTYTTLMNACMITDPAKYLVTGGPRNDYLFHADGTQNLRRILGECIRNQRIAFYLPTFREGGGAGEESLNLFGFDHFDEARFESFLASQGLLLVIKPHPHNQEAMRAHFARRSSQVVMMISDRDLAMHRLDLYELLNAADMLITDYSSVYYDFLLLDRPLVFLPTDLDRYKASRGFLVESFESWTPGAKVFSQIELEEALQLAGGAADHWRAHREMMRSIMHRYWDGNSAERLWNEIDKRMGANSRAAGNTDVVER